MTTTGILPNTAVPNVHLKKADIAYGYLRELIINGTFAPGQRLTLAEVSGACGMSHMPVREALLRLARDGLLESEPHKGVRVVELSLKEAKELFAVRTELEGLAAYAACAAADAASASALAVAALAAAARSNSASLDDFAAAASAAVARARSERILS